MSKSTKPPVKPEEVAIKVSSVSKTFKLPHEKHNSIKGLFLNIFKGSRTFEKQQVLNDISFEVKKGDFLGIVGRNGSGKSTLLKLLAGIYTPDKGHIQVNGKLVPFIELGVGFNPELTGRENVFLNGALLGFDRKEMSSMYKEIVEFAELEQFMDQKLKNYSSGMQVRLAFSIAIRAKADILLLDEVLAVGDEAFQRKCFSYFAELKKNKKTVVLVTHSMDSVQRFCTRAMLIDKGHRTVIGSPLEITKIYNELNSESGTTVNSSKQDKSETRFINVESVYSSKNNNLSFELDLTPKQHLHDPIVAFLISRDNGELVYRWVSDEDEEGKSLVLVESQTTKINITIQDIFPVGGYTVTVLVRKRDRTKDYGVFNDIVTFDVPNRTAYEFSTLWKPETNISILNSNE